MDRVQLGSPIGKIRHHLADRHRNYRQSTLVHRAGTSKDTKELDQHLLGYPGLRRHGGVVHQRLQDLAQSDHRIRTATRFERRMQDHDIYVYVGLSHVGLAHRVSDHGPFHRRTVPLPGGPDLYDEAVGAGHRHSAVRTRPVQRSPPVDDAPARIRERLQTVRPANRRRLYERTL